MSNVCPAGSAAKSSASAASWNGWSPDPLNNTRYQTAKAANMSPAAVGRLELKWAFGLPITTSAYAQPIVVNGKLFVGSDSGYMYALDAVTGCVYWSFQAKAGVRSTPMVAPAKPGSSQTALYFGDIHGNVYSVDTSNGELLWTVPVDPHPLSRITAGVRVYNGRVYLAVASLEEPEAGSFTYKCCTFRGIVTALDASTGKQIWKYYTLPPATPQVTSTGIKFMGPSGAGVWGAVTLDPKRRAVYFSTGNAFSDPDVGGSDAVMAISMDTGKSLWTKQVLHGDVRSSGNCAAVTKLMPLPSGYPRGANRRPGAPLQAGRGGRGGNARTRQEVGYPEDYYCPEHRGPDVDFSAGVMLVDLPNGKSLVVAAQKSGMLWAFDPDKKGELVWSSDVSRGEVTFGAATDGENGYFPFRGGALAAVRLSDGVELWSQWIDPQPSMKNHRGISAAATLIPGVIFTAGLDGMVRAFSAFNGAPLWQYDTTQPVKTVNGVDAKGGSIGSAGVTVVNGMLYVTSGYIGFQGGQPGNLLLAFGPPSD
jgi:polyvinyl alcohol dehydrogenase (cytochrome)